MVLIVNMLHTVYSCTNKSIKDSLYRCWGSLAECVAFLYLTMHTMLETQHTLQLSTNDYAKCRVAGAYHHVKGRSSMHNIYAIYDNEAH